MSSNIRTCPHCGAGIIGETDRCPRCDQPLPAQLSAPATFAPEPKIEPIPTTEDEAVVEVPDEKPDEEYGQTAPVPAELIGITGKAATEDEQAASSPYASTRHTPMPPPPPSIAVPPAPYTPPPIIPDATRSVVAYSYPSNYYLEQRVEAYHTGGYDLLTRHPYQVVMSHGKPLGILWWLIAMMSGVGLVWYLLILLSSSFSKDRVYIIVERDGALFEDGSGAAHTRRYRARIGQRWGFIGVIVFFLALIWFAGMVVGGLLGYNEYRAELKAAYPDVTFFTSNGSVAEQTALNPDDIQFAETAAIVYVILTTISLIGVFSGLALTIVGYLHSAAYKVSVPPLPDYY